MNAMFKWALLLAVAIFPMAGGCGKSDPAEWIGKLGSKDPEVRKTAAFKLADYGKAAAAAVPALMRALDDEDGDVVIWAMHALGEIGPDARAAVPLLQAKLNDKDWNIRNLAKFALERIGEDSVPAVVAQLRSENRDKRKEAANLLVDIGTKAIPEMRKAIEDKDYRVRYWAAHILGEIDPNSSETLEIINKLKKDSSSAVREKAVEVLGKIGKEGKGTTAP